MTKTSEFAPSSSDLEKQKLLLEIEHLQTQVEQLAIPMWRRPSVFIPFLALLVAVTTLVLEVNQSRKSEKIALTTATEKTTEAGGLLESLKAKEENLETLQEDVRVLTTTLKEVGVMGGERISSVDQRLEEEAQANIRWIMQLGSGARQTYERELTRTKSKFAAALKAQNHNPNAQEVLRRYGEQHTVRYIEELGG
jgi:hypothetical protein